MLKKLLLAVLLLFCLSSVLSSAVGYGETVQEQTRAELLTLKTQLLNCQQKIITLQRLIIDLDKKTLNYEKLLMDYQAQLAAQEKTYKTLSKQLEDLKSYVTKLETENTLLWIGGGILAATVVVLIIAR